MFTAIALVAIAAGPFSGSEAQPIRAAADGHSAGGRCKTVTPHTYNKRVRLLREITGNNRRGTLTKRKRCKYGAYADLGQAVRKARADCLTKLQFAMVSHYGRGDGFAYRRTACGQILTPGIIGAAHKTLPCGTIRYFRTSSGRGLRVPVIDRGPYIAGREFDLTSWTADIVGGFDGVGTAAYNRNNCWAR